MTPVEGWDHELKHTWPLLRTRSTTEITTAPLSFTPEVDPVRIGVDGAGTRHLLVPLAGGDPVRSDDGESALTLRVRTYTFGRSPSQYLDIVCVRPDLFDLFDEVLVDLLTTVADKKDESPARTAVEVVARWRALLITRRGSLLTLTGQMALFAELTVLDLITRSGPWEAGWWRGPLREPHDLRLPERAVEVKAYGAGVSSVEIHGLTQLEPPGVPLGLVLTEVGEAAMGITLPDLVDRVLTRVDDRGAAVRLLAKVGYSLGDADRYDERFAVTGLGLVEVTDTVPRIVPASFGAAVPVGVGGVVYRIELDALDPHIARGQGALLAWAAG